ncbi:uncharacterized protein AMSG_01923 [Thecamonas trahens ATCC 50062]|uniref:Uncharacterized protein n=1 Tax=Thecamonas trahens ATCC 50062 TaxID=461836 RepID=A0A0L0DVW1_THETB|nr:hypothetical protein AMSG_01923 [Thecamonas trahens ATCC 50062]KNC55653.1 hypothetical protein AMSG_01923 [Thecamonas trahens ATCC 50062]|eukprot:XP_013761422.1 hypothetical protein AMSG_01923 [Thecamonas trahens ATCC 50062]
MLSSTASPSPTPEGSIQTESSSVSYDAVSMNFSSFDEVVDAEPVLAPTSAAGQAATSAESGTAMLGYQMATESPPATPDASDVSTASSSATPSLSLSLSLSPLDSPAPLDPQRPPARSAAPPSVPQPFRFGETNRSSGEPRQIDDARRGLDAENAYTKFKKTEAIAAGGLRPRAAAAPRAPLRTLSANAFRSKLHDTLVASRIIPTMQAQLRTQILESLRGISGKGLVPKSSAASDTSASLTDLAINRLIAQYCEAAGYHYALSVFMPESGTALESPLDRSDVLKALGLAADAVPDDGSARSWLAQIVAALAAHPRFKGTLVDAGSQTLETGMAPGSSLDSKLAAVDMAMNTRLGGAGSTAGSTASMEEQMAVFERELTLRMQDQLREQMAQFKSAELSSMRLQEAAKHRAQLAAEKEALEREYAARAGRWTIATPSSTAASSASTRIQTAAERDAALDLARRKLELEREELRARRAALDAEANELDEARAAAKAKAWDDFARYKQEYEALQRDKNAALAADRSFLDEELAALAERKAKLGSLPAEASELRSELSAAKAALADATAELNTLRAAKEAATSKEVEWLALYTQITDELAEAQSVAAQSEQELAAARLRIIELEHDGASRGAAAPSASVAAATRAELYPAPEIDSVFSEYAARDSPVKLARPRDAREAAREAGHGSESAPSGAGTSDVLARAQAQIAALAKEEAELQSKLFSQSRVLRHGQSSPPPPAQLPYAPARSTTPPREPAAQPQSPVDVERHLSCIRGGELRPLAGSGALPLEERIRRQMGSPPRSEDRNDQEARLRAEREAHEAALRSERAAEEARLQAKRAAAEEAQRAAQTEIARIRAEAEEAKRAAEREAHEASTQIAAARAAAEAEAGSVAAAEAARIKAETAAYREAAAAETAAQVEAAQAALAAAEAKAAAHREAAVVEADRVRAEAVAAASAEVERIRAEAEQQRIEAAAALAAETEAAREAAAAEIERVKAEAAAEAERVKAEAAAAAAEAERVKTEAAAEAERAKAEAAAAARREQDRRDQEELERQERAAARDARLREQQREMEARLAEQASAAAAAMPTETATPAGVSTGLQTQAVGMADAGTSPMAMRQDSPPMASSGSTLESISFEDTDDDLDELLSYGVGGAGSAVGASGGAARAPPVFESQFRPPRLPQFDAEQEARLARELQEREARIESEKSLRATGARQAPADDPVETQVRIETERAERLAREDAAAAADLASQLDDEQAKFFAMAKAKRERERAASEAAATEPGRHGSSSTSASSVDELLLDDSDLDAPAGGYGGLGDDDDDELW